MNFRLERSQSVTFLILVLLTAVVIIWAFENKNALQNHHEITVGLVNDCYAGGRGNIGTILLYKFEINGKVVNGTVSFNSRVLTLTNAENRILGKTFPVAYNPQHPSNNFLNN